MYIAQCLCTYTVQVHVHTDYSGEYICICTCTCTCVVYVHMCMYTKCIHACTCIVQEIFDDLSWKHFFTSLHIGPPHVYFCCYGSFLSMYMYILYFLLCSVVLCACEYMYIVHVPVFFHCRHHRHGVPFFGFSILGNGGVGLLQLRVVGSDGAGRGLVVVSRGLQRLPQLV